MRFLPLESKMENGVARNLNDKKRLFLTYKQSF